MEGIGKKAEIALQKHVVAFSKMNQQVAAQQDKVTDLEKQLKEMAGQTVETDQYKQLNSEIAKLEKAIDNVKAKQDRFLATGESKYSDVYIKTASSIKEMTAELEKQRGYKLGYEVSGQTKTTAYLGAVEEVERLEAKLAEANQLKDKLISSGKAYSKPIAQYTADIGRLAAKLEEAYAKKQALESSGGATAAVDTSAIEKKLAAEREKLTLMNDRLSLSYQELNTKVDSYKKKLFSADGVTKSISKSTHRFGSRLREIMMGALVFNVISAGLRSLTSYYGAALKSNNEFSSALARLKGALYTAFQPIYEAVLPALITLMRILTAVIQVVGQFFAAISGKSYGQMAQNAKALNNQAKAIGGVGDAAKDAQKDLYSFDEINRQSDISTSGGSGGGGAAGEIAPNFEETEITDGLKHILYLVGAIGAGLLAWKIASAFTDSLKLAAGIGMAVGGGFLYAFNWADAFSNGINWGNLSGMLAGMLITAVGLGVAFGTIGAAVALLVGGIGLVVLGLKEWIETGKLSNEACAALVTGIIAIGAAIALFTGNWIPLLLATIVGFVVAAVAKGQEIKNALNRFSDWLKNIFCKDWTQVFGVALGSQLNLFVGIVGGILGGLKQMLFGLIDFLQGVFTGNWKQAWNGMYTIARGVINGIIGVVNGMISAVVNGVNALFRLLSFNISLPGGRSIGLRLPQFSAPQIPYLAQGAVIPPNAPFAAVLGDQRHGNNIEAPEDLIRKIVREEAAGGASNDEIVALLRKLIEVVMGIKIGDETIGRAAMRYTRRYNQARGV